MQNLSNIEKSAFKPGEYVGYGAGTVWRISRNDIGWRAASRGEILDGYPSLHVLCRATLRELSNALTELSEE